MQEYNGVMMQYFHWYTPADGTLWNQLAKNAPELAKAGITAVWLPPAYKGVAGKNDVGYAVYDLFDLGEFKQKGSVRTKYGTRKAYLKAIKAAQKENIQVYADIVFNHKMGADFSEEFKALPYDVNNRTVPIGEMRTIQAWTHFTFPGRDKKYSELEWHWWHFNSADYNALDENQRAIYLFEGKHFDEDVDHEKGNFDYLMGCNLDINNPDVRKELLYWGEWLLDTTGIDGFRFDAVKHVKPHFFMEWLTHLRKYSGRNLFAVGEYWSTNISALKHFVSLTEGGIMLFDSGLHYNFSAASKQGQAYDLRELFNNTLISEIPNLAITLVSNHDTQPLQALESVVESWFKPLAYALILLRRDGYPCIFAADYYGAKYRDLGKDGKTYTIEMPGHQCIIDKFLEARKKYAYGNQTDYFDHPNCIGWTRSGNDKNKEGLAVLLSNGQEGSKNMQTASANTTYIDLTEHITQPVVTNDEGWGEFHCLSGSVSVWVPKQ
ncbi:MAG: alpha-amylase [Bacteroidales bacterium]|jgi:alpha-amylase|nr:alpha-amylase [Bacteroidales bacterium]